MTFSSSGISRRAGIEISAIIAIAQQPMMYQLIPVLEPVSSRIFAAISGAGPPAMTEASW